MQFKAVFLAFAVAATPLSAQSGAESLQSRAEAALVAANPAETRRLADQMLDAAPDSFVALYLMALAQSDLNDPQNAAIWGARAYAVAPTQDTRYETARFVAGAHFQAGHYTRSGLWLRRAAGHAKNDSEREFLAEAYRTTTQANPLSLQFAAAIAPTDNINNGSDDGVLRLEGIDLTFVLPEDRQSLSGVGFSASTALQYRISQSAQQSTALTGTLSGVFYALSSDAKDLLASSPNPDVRAIDGRDFSTLTAGIGMTRRQNNLSPLGPVRFGATIGSFWEGGERLVDFRDLSFAQVVPINPSNQVQLAGLIRTQNALKPTLRDARITDLTATYDHLLVNRDQLQLSLSAKRSDSGAETSYDEYQFGVGYQFADTVSGARLSTSLNIGTRHFEEFVTTLDGRDDRFVLASATAVFEEFDSFGFAPSISVSATRTVSTAEEETTSAVEILFGVASTF